MSPDPEADPPEHRPSGVEDHADPPRRAGPRGPLGQAGRFIGAIGGMLGIAAAFAVLFGPAPGMGFVVPAPSASRPAAIVEAIAADPLPAAVALGWPFLSGMVSLYGGYAALRVDRRRVLVTGVGLVFLIMLGPPGMAALLPAAVAFLVTWAVFAGDVIVRRRGLDQADSTTQASAEANQPDRPPERRE